MLSTEQLADIGKRWGPYWFLLFLLIGGIGWGCYTLVLNVTARIDLQDEKIAKQDEFIQTDLMNAHVKTAEIAREALQVSRECADALRCNAEAFKEFKAAR